MTKDKPQAAPKQAAPLVGPKVMAERLGVTAKTLRRKLRQVPAYDDDKFTYYLWEDGSPTYLKTVEAVKKLMHSEKKPMVIEDDSLFDVSKAARQGNPNK